jgi:hypothetical protein
MIKLQNKIIKIKKNVFSSYKAGSSCASCGCENNDSFTDISPFQQIKKVQIAMQVM